MTNLEQALLGHGRLWFPGLAGTLVRRWRAASLETYSTSAFFSEGRWQPRAEMPVASAGAVPCTVVETLHEKVERAFQGQGLVFATEVDAISADTNRRMQEAFFAIESSPTLGSSVRELARRTHLLRAKGDAFDVSHSDPGLPLSVFVSVPMARQKNEAWRLAESFIHEAMHLQLSLTERLAPMIEAEAGRYYSPWRQVDRPVGGVLHGLYVFGVIHQWLGQLDTGSDYVSARKKDIEAEVRQIHDFPAARGLTGLGCALAQKVLATVLHH